MEKFVNRLFADFGFVTEEVLNTPMFFSRQGKDRAEYYLLLLVGKTDLSSSMDSKLERVNILFNEKKKSAKDVEKNTSLVIFVEFDSFREDCLKYKNRLLQIEEDEYFYRKYVIPYTKDALSLFNAQESIENSINKAITDESNFETFNNHMYSNEPYFFAMQLCIKLPFLNLSVNRSGEFATIETLLSQRIATTEQRFLDNILQTHQPEQNERDQLLKKVLDPNDNTFDSFINSFLGDAPTS